MRKFLKKLVTSIGFPGDLKPEDMESTKSVTPFSLSSEEDQTLLEVSLGGCNHRANSGTYCVTKHNFPNGEVSVRCLRCGKTWWNPDREKEVKYYSSEEIAALKKQQVNESYKIPVFTKHEQPEIVNEVVEVGGDNRRFKEVE